MVNPETTSYTEGRLDTFWLVNVANVSVYSEEFELRLVTPRAYWYVERGLNVSTADLEDAAEVFEERIYPKVTSAMGREWSPGVDNDVHITFLHGRIRGVAGYFSSSDEYSVSVNPYSNQREILYLNTEFLRVGSRSYLTTLAHELQHLVHWFADPGEETWVNEGLSEVAVTIAGYDSGLAPRVLRSPTPSLVHWPLDPLGSGSHYGQAFLFFDYLANHFGTVDDLKDLLAEPEDGIEGVSAYLASLGSEKSFREVFRDWLVANLLDEPGGGLYGYPDRDIRVVVSGTLGTGDQRVSRITQFSGDYVEIDSAKDGVAIFFDGQSDTPLIPVAVGPEGCWWSNRGDSISTTLARQVDLTGVERATLKYRVWYDVEEDWDYGYVEVSTDGGSTWDIMQAPGTSPRNPVGNSFGPGYTGASDGWIEETVDLSAYAGEKILLRFHYITDDSLNWCGPLLR